MNSTVQKKLRLNYERLNTDEIILRYPGCANLVDDELSLRFYTMIVFQGGGYQKLKFEDGKSYEK